MKLDFKPSCSFFLVSSIPCSFFGGSAFIAAVALPEPVVLAAAGANTTNEVWFVKDYSAVDGPVAKNFRREDKAKLFLNASGSSQPTAEQIECLKEQFKDYKLIDVDLREESHVLVNGKSFSWFSGENQINRGKSLSEIVESETALAHALGANKHLKAHSLGKAFPDTNVPNISSSTNEIDVQTAQTEKEYCAQSGVEYKRIPVPDYQSPDPKSVDDFVAFVKSLGLVAKVNTNAKSGATDNPSRRSMVAGTETSTRANTRANTGAATGAATGVTTRVSPDAATGASVGTPWLHFHCAAGRGRTTTFLAMYDMMLHASTVDFDELIERQRKFSGADLAALNPKDAWKAPYALKRLEFIRDFYSYCKDQLDKGYEKNFSVWLSEHRKDKMQQSPLR